MSTKSQESPKKQQKLDKRAAALRDNLQKRKALKKAQKADTQQDKKQD